jgi:hypothetical protein
VDRKGIRYWANRLFWALCSLKLAVIVLLCLAASCATATILESLYDTPTAQYYIYRSFWFHGILGLLGLEILLVALSRLPWKRRHLPFLLAHAGIILMLTGSWVTEHYGLDGSMRISEGETSAAVEVNEPTLTITEGDHAEYVPIRWTPPIARFSPVSLDHYGIRVDQFMSHADVKVSFVPSEPGDLTEVYPAIRFSLEGGPMRIHQEYWLWAGDPAWSVALAGPARLELSAPVKPALGEAHLPPSDGPEFHLTVQKNGELAWSSRNSEGKVRTGRIRSDQAKGELIETGWAAGMKVHVLDYIPRAVSQTTYTPSRVQFGQDAPPSAIHLTAGHGGKDSEMWLGIGDRANLEYQGRKISLAYFPKRLALPFALRLERFNIDRYQGTMSPMSYSSKVSVVDTGPNVPQGPTVISMNEPLEYKGITFYQASYEDARPRPTTSIFSVNRDPGRWMKYLGSLLIVFGSALLFASKYKKSKTAQKTAGAAGSSPVEVTSV